MKRKQATIWPKKPKNQPPRANKQKNKKTEERFTEVKGTDLSFFREEKQSRSALGVLKRTCSQQNKEKVL